jgi:DnaJ-domain-containing protein 1
MALPTPHNYFSIFSLKPQFLIDQGDLKRTYFALSRENHPDTAREGSTTDIQELNRAYRVLSNDFLRAKYLTGFGDVKADQPFLLSVLEVEESIDGTDDPEGLGAIKRALDSRISECKLNYNKREFMGKWPYYERLKERLKKKMGL